MMRLMAGLLALLVIDACKGSSHDDGGTPPRAPRDAGDLGATGGQCVVECQSPADCCQGEQCGQSIFHFNCTMGRCEQIGCTSDVDCSTQPGGKCAVLGSFGLCGRGCALPEDCCPPLPPGLSIPPGRDSLTVAFDGGQATFYRCGVYPQKFICTGTDVAPDDAGSIGICLRVCNADPDCPGIAFPAADGGLVHVRVDGGSVAFPSDAGLLRFFDQVCVPQFPGAPFGTCQKGCSVDSDCCPDPSGASCTGIGFRQVCVSGHCVKDGCRGDEECSAGQCTVVR